ncbi:MAG: NADH-quinone oxidoreductase subunit C [Actinomycetota bacterium]|nr:NADH-quinone oxidoreductase subunit C [Actinomycetota bacterium]HSH23751.1 NADH-quinone oxidoreductase subunit C [Acidimicrobiales bacterium]
MSRLSSAADEATPESVAPAADVLLTELRQHLGDAVLDSGLAGSELCVRLDRRAWRRAADVCRNQLGFDYFCFLSGIDWQPNPTLSGEKVWDPDGSVAVEGADEEEAEVEGGMQTGLAGGESRFQLLARLASTQRKTGVTFKADLDEADPRVESWVGVYRGADWHERETWEMFGFSFDGHPSLRHMYLPGEFEGHPLRKDFPLLAREVKPWPGLVDVEAMPGEEEGAEGSEDAS